MLKDLNFLKITKDLLSKEQLRVLEEFILKTVLNYSKSIKWYHYLQVSTRLLFMNDFNYKTKKLIKKSYKKVSL